MQKIIIFGGSGLLGSGFVQFLKEQQNVELLLPKHQKCDINNKWQLVDIFEEFKPNLVINCVADLGQDVMEREPASGLATNLAGVYFLASLCKKYDCELMHFGSTVDNEITNIYALSKFFSNMVPEVAGLNKYYVYRLGWLFGDKTLSHKNFTNLLIKSIESEREMGLTDNRFISPTYIDDVVRYCWEQYQNKNYGVYPLSNEGKTTIWKFANELSQEMGKKHNFNINNDFCDVAPRPIDASNSENTMRSYQQALKEFIYELRQQQGK